MNAHYDHLYLSPHFDDAALSCGGQIARHTAAGETVLVVTLTGGDPPADAPSDTARALHNRWAQSAATAGAGNVAEAMVAQRRAEDRAALAVLGADYLHLPFLDCIYRCGPDGAAHYPGPADMFGPAADADEATVAAWVGALAALPSAGRVYAPLGIGGHVDHLATRRAAGRVFAAALYYEEYPYTMWPGALEQALGEGETCPATTCWLDEAELAAKTAAVAAYVSQLSSFFADDADMAAKLRAEGQRALAAARDDGDTPPPWAAGAERLWRFT